MLVGFWVSELHLSCGALELRKQLGELVEGTADEFDVVGASEVVRKRRLRRQVLEIVRQDFAATSATFAMLHSVKEAFEAIVRPRDDPDTSSSCFRQLDHMPPEGVSVAIEMLQDDVDRLAPVFSGTSGWTLSAEATGERP